MGYRKGYLRATFKIAAGAMAYAGPQPRDPAEPFGSAMRQGSRAVPKRWGDFAVEFYARDRSIRAVEGGFVGEDW